MLRSRLFFKLAIDFKKVVDLWDCSWLTWNGRAVIGGGMFHITMYSSDVYD